MSKDFVHLHVHTCYSLLDGLTKIPELFDKVAKLNQSAVAITDHGAMYAMVDAAKYAQKNDQHFIPGCEVYWVPDATVKDKSERSSENDASRKHFLLLAKNNEGYKRLMKICSWGCSDGYYYRPRVDDSIFEKYGTDGIIATSACFLPSDNLDVLTKDGIKNLLDVKSGDYVQSHTGKWRRVICPTTREYIGNFYTIKVQGGLPLTVTENHKFFILTANQLKNYTKYSLTSFFDTINIHHTTSQKYLNNIYSQNMRQFEPQGIEAKNIQSGDYIISSIDEMINDIQEINIDFVYQKQCQKHLKTYILEITNEFLELIGIYIAKGSLIIHYTDQCEYGINFSLNMKDQIIQDKVTQYMFSIFGLLPYKHQNKNSDCVIYTYSSKEIYLLFSSWFQQGVQYKHIPEFIKYLPFNRQMFCIKGIFLGDDHISKQLNKRTNKVHNGIIFVTISKQLVYDIIHILNRNWINPAIKFKKSYIDKAAINHRNNYYIYIDDPIATYFKYLLQNNIEFTIDYKIWRQSKHLPFEWNGKKYLKYPIKSIQSFYGKKQVYCLNVDIDHTFTICNIKSFNCIAGVPAQKLLHDDYKGARESILHYAKMFKDGYYIEIQPTEDERQVKVNKGLIELSKELGIPCIATTDAHYLNKEDKTIHDVLLCIQSGAKLKDPDRWRFIGNSYYIMSRDELTQAFKCNGHEQLDQQIIEEAMDNTVNIANQCQVNFTFGKHYLPKVNPPSEEENPDLMRQYGVFENRRIAEVAKKNNISMEEAKNRLDPSSEYLRFLLIHGWHGLYAQGLLDKQHLSLMFYETDVVLAMDFPSYFLILQEIMEFCYKSHIATGPARGCFLDNNIVTIAPYIQRKINEIVKNDKVLGLDNQYHSVLNKYEYDCNEDVIEIQVENNKVINGITKDHKVLGIKKDDYLKYQYEYDNNLKQPKWYSIDELDIDDYLIEI